MPATWGLFPCRNNYLKCWFGSRISVPHSTVKILFLRHKSKKLCKTKTNQPGVQAAVFKKLWVGCRRTGLIGLTGHWVGKTNEGEFREQVLRLGLFFSPSCAQPRARCQEPRGDWAGPGSEDRRGPSCGRVIVGQWATGEHRQGGLARGEAPAWARPHRGGRGTQPKLLVCFRKCRAPQGLSGASVSGFPLEPAAAPTATLSCALCSCQHLRASPPGTPRPAERAHPGGEGPLHAPGGQPLHSRLGACRRRRACLSVCGLLVCPLSTQLLGQEWPLLCPLPSQSFRQRALVVLEEQLWREGHQQIEVWGS